MPITYTNRRGITYHLCRTVGDTGTARYVFAREPRGEPVEELPDGYTIAESINGRVTLSRQRPSPIEAAEIAAVEAAVQRHPQAADYRVGVKDKTIVVYKRTGLNLDGLAALLGRSGLPVPASRVEEARAEFDRHARYTPVLRFILLDAAQRTFHPQRWCYLGSVDGWLDLAVTGSLEELAARLVPTLGTDDFYQLY